MTQLRNDTLNKLEESCYFLTQMKQTANDWMLFRFNLSAFLSSARSITFVMQKKYHQTAGFASWYKLQQEKMRKDGVLTLFINLRDISIHQKPVKLRFLFSFSLADVFAMPSGSTIQLGDKKEGTYLTNASAANITPADVTKIHAGQTWRLDEKPDEDVITLCERYLSRLSTLVYECSERFDTIVPN